MERWYPRNLRRTGPDLRPDGRLRAAVEDVVAAGPPVLARKKVGPIPSRNGAVMIYGSGTDVCHIDLQMTGGRVERRRSEPCELR